MGAFTDLFHACLAWADWARAGRPTVRADSARSSEQGEKRENADTWQKYQTSRILLSSLSKTGTIFERLNILVCFFCSFFLHHMILLQTKTQVPFFVEKSETHIFFFLFTKRGRVVVYTWVICVYHSRVTASSTRDLSRFTFTFQ